MSVLDQVQLVVPANGSTIEQVLTAKPLQPFGNETLAFLDAFSKRLALNKQLRKYAELVALAFWFRKDNLQKLKTIYESESAVYKTPIGIVFHIAPSNVDSIFIYSWFLSMLAGNINVVRISSTANEQMDLLLQELNALIDSEFSQLATAFAVVRYPHNDEITEALSMACNLRVIWGGDGTVRRIRSIALAPNAAEIAFSNKFSMALVNVPSLALCTEAELENLATKFYNDAYWFNQMACSSPRMVFFHQATEANKAVIQRFWTALEAIIAKKGYQLAPSQAVDKLTAMYQTALKSPQSFVQQETDDNRLVRLQLKDAGLLNRTFHCGGGLFYEAYIDNLSHLADLFTNADQSLCYYGYLGKDLATELLSYQPKGICRIVPIGQALQFTPHWDGYALLNSFSRLVEVL